MTNPNKQTPIEVPDIETAAKTETTPASRTSSFSAIIQRWKREDLIKKASQIMRGLCLLFSLLAFIIMVSNKNGYGLNFDKYEKYNCSDTSGFHSGEAIYSRLYIPTDPEAYTHDDQSHTLAQVTAGTFVGFTIFTDTIFVIMIGVEMKIRDIWHFQRFLFFTYFVILCSFMTAISLYNGAFLFGMSLSGGNGKGDYNHHENRFLQSDESVCVPVFPRSLGQIRVVFCPLKSVFDGFESSFPLDDANLPTPPWSWHCVEDAPVFLPTAVTSMNCCTIIGALLWKAIPWKPPWKNKCIGTGVVESDVPSQMIQIESIQWVHIRIEGQHLIWEVAMVMLRQKPKAVREMTLRRLHGMFMKNTSWRNVPGFFTMLISTRKQDSKTTFNKKTLIRKRWY